MFRKAEDGACSRHGRQRKRFPRDSCHSAHCWPWQHTSRGCCHVQPRVLHNAHLQPSHISTTARPSVRDPPPPRSSQTSGLASASGDLSSPSLQVSTWAFLHGGTSAATGEQPSHTCTRLPVSRAGNKAILYQSVRAGPAKRWFGCLQADSPIKI